MEGGADDGTRVVYGYDYYTVISSGGMAEESEGAIKSENADAETSRRQMLHNADPVNMLTLSSDFKMCFEECAKIQGENFRVATQAMDANIAGQLKLVLEAASKPT